MIDQQKSQKHELDLQILRAAKLQYFKKKCFSGQNIRMDANHVNRYKLFLILTADTHK